MEGVLNGIPAFPERLNPSCHCCIARCFAQSLKKVLVFYDFVQLKFCSRNVALVL